MKRTVKLVGREPEIEVLNNLLNADEAAFLAVYGRRRVGKTFLIRQHLKDHIIFDITGTKDGTKEQQLQNFFEEYLKRTGSKKKLPPPTTWLEAFRYLAEYARRLRKRKLSYVIFIDEMPWLDLPKSNFISALEFFWNQHLSKQDNIILIACGSASSWIRKKLLNARGGLYNRVTHRIQLKPFNLNETELYLSSIGAKLSRYQLLELYMAMGGIPFYLKEITGGKSATQLIDQICFSPKGLLQHEYGQLYHSLFSNAEYHTKVIEALAAKPQGATRSFLAQKTKLSEATLSRTLEDLVDCDFISYYEPLINRKKTATYKLTDPYSLFYLKFIRTNKTGGKGSWEQLSAKPAYAAWSGYAFENICMAHLPQIKKALGIAGIYSTTGSWVFNGNDAMPGAQVDMIIDRADQTINLCEAKFSKENFVLTKNYADQLRMKKSIFQQATKSKKSIFITLLTTYPAVKNMHYLGMIQNEINMDHLFYPD